jgi:hypothetical protein
MTVASTVIAVLLSLMVAFSAALKLRRDPRVAASIHDVVGVPLDWFPSSPPSSWPARPGC